MGHAVQADEEQLRVQLETLQAELNAPTQFKVHYNKLQSIANYNTPVQCTVDAGKHNDVIVRMFRLIQGRLNELMSQLRMHNQQLSGARPDSTYQIDPLLQGEIKQVNSCDQTLLLRQISQMKKYCSCNQSCIEYWVVFFVRGSMYGYII